MQDKDTIIILLAVALVGALASIAQLLDITLLITLWVAEVPIGVLIHIMTRQPAQPTPLQIAQASHPPPSIEDQKWLASTSPRVYDFLRAVPLGINSKQYEIYLAQLRLLLNSEKADTGDDVKDYDIENQTEMIARAYLLSRWREG